MPIFMDNRESLYYMVENETTHNWVFKKKPNTIFFSKHGFILLKIFGNDLTIWILIEQFNQLI